MYKRCGFDPWMGKIPWRRAWQYSCLENPMDRGAWLARVHSVGHIGSQSQMRLQWLNTHTCIVDLQCCVGFRCITKWLSYTCTYTDSFSDSFPYRLLQSLELGSLCYTVGSYWLFILNILSMDAYLVASVMSISLRPQDCTLLGSSVLGILQARLLGWVAIPSSKGFSRPGDGTWVSCIAGKLYTV